MPRIEHNKLVRDFVPENIRKNGDVCEVRTLEGEEFLIELKKKIDEEGGELHPPQWREVGERDRVIGFGSRIAND